ncbi:unnamed protein product [Schistocephalus solidus]|uniref:Uncharacterized protein n=1 Tax=Schistocephalus solidus TaxID=70667 RepID=A0A183T5Q5_SCHSO|nr:unnamed protein product [Schistocephalus solidus]
MNIKKRWYAERLHVAPFDDDKCIVNVSGPEFRGRGEELKARRSSLCKTASAISPDRGSLPRSNRPERRTALVARELARYKVHIAALSETRFSEQGQLEETEIVGRLPCLTQDINDHLTSLRLSLRRDKFATSVSIEGG